MTLAGLAHLVAFLLQTLVNHHALVDGGARVEGEGGVHAVALLA